MKQIYTLIILLFFYTNVFSATNIDDTKQILKMYWQCHTISELTEKAGTSSFPSEYLNICTLTSQKVQKKYFNDDFKLLHDWTVINYRLKPLTIVSK